MRCPKCGVNNYGDVSSCHSCGEILSQAPVAESHRYGPCPHCGNPQAEYFAAGRGQCRTCVRTFTWKQELAQQEKPPEEESSSSMLYMIIAIVIVVVVVAAAVGAYFLMSADDDDDSGDDGPLESDYFTLSAMSKDTANPTSGQNVTVGIDITFTRPSSYDEKKVHVELFFNYLAQSTGAKVSGHEAMSIPWWADVTNVTETTKVPYLAELSFDDITGPVELQVKIYSSREWSNTKPVDDKSPLATSEMSSDLLVYA